MSDLTTAVADLERYIEFAKRDLREYMARYPNLYQPGMADPGQRQDQNGRYILLDAQTALVNALVALKETP